MDKELIIWILTAVMGTIDVGSLIAVAIAILKGVSKRVEDSTGLKGELKALNKNLAKAIEQNEKLKEENHNLMLEMKGLKGYAGKGIGIHREIKK